MACLPVGAVIVLPVAVLFCIAGLGCRLLLAMACLPVGAVIAWIFLACCVDGYGLLVGLFLALCLL